ncbi:forkhead box protein P2-like [Drosophila virilis]|uniref:forkhead box protein P2-like n=1 Tax=Drosophila virilis TaxID=7244 RepID=UPI0038B2392E
MRINSLRRHYREGRITPEELKLAIREQPLLIQQLVLPRELAIQIYQQQQQQRQQQQQQQHQQRQQQRQQQPQQQQQEQQQQQQQQQQLQFEGHQSTQSPDIIIVLDTEQQQPEQQLEQPLSQPQLANLQQQRLTEDEQQLKQRLELLKRQLEREMDEASYNAANPSWNLSQLEAAHQAHQQPLSSNSIRGR